MEEKIKICNFKKCGKVLCKKDLMLPKVSHNGGDYIFCRKHLLKVNGMIAEIRRAEDKLSKNLIIN